MLAPGADMPTCADKFSALVLLRPPARPIAAFVGPMYPSGRQHFTPSMTTTAKPTPRYRAMSPLCVFRLVLDYSTTSSRVLSDKYTPIESLCSSQTLTDTTTWTLRALSVASLR